MIFGHLLKEKRKKKRHNWRINMDRIIRDIRTLFETKNKKKKESKRGKMKKIVKDNISRDIRILFEQEKEEDYYEPKRVNNFWNNNYIEYENNGDKNRNLSLDEDLNKIETYLRKIINNIQNSDRWKIQLTIATNFVSSKDTEEERVMLLSSDNIKFTSYNEVNDVTEKLLKSLHSKYQDGLETSIKGSDLVFDSVHLM